MTQPDPATGPWHLDKRVPVALLMAILVQTFGMGWWAASISERVSSLENTRTDGKDTGGRLMVLESQMKDIKAILQRIEYQVRKDSE
jgi:hypothetical protein